MADDTTILEYIWNSKTFYIQAVREFHEKLQNDHSYAHEYFENMTQNDEKHINNPAVYDNRNSPAYVDSSDEMYISHEELLDEESENLDRSIVNFENVVKDIAIKTWTVPATRLLLKEYKKRVKHFRNPKVKKSILWREIETVLKGKNYDFDSATIQGKFRNMKHTYRKIKKNHSKRKTAAKRQSWLYLNEMDEIFSDDELIDFSSSEVISSMGDDNSTPTNLFHLNKSVEDTDNIVQKTSTSNNSRSESNTAGTSSSSKSGQSSNFTKLYCNRQKQLDTDDTMLGILKNLGEKIDLARRVRKNNALLQAQKTSELTDAINARTEVLRNISDHLVMLLDGVKKNS